MRTTTSRQVPFRGWATTLVPSRRPIKCETVVQPLCILGLVLLLGTVALADIQIKATYDPGEPIIAKVLPTDIPPGATLKGTVTVTGVSGIWQPDPEKTEYGVWAVAGEHVIQAIGSWLLVDETGKAIDHNYYLYSKTFTVTGKVPDPPPPPPPKGKWQIAFFYESADLDNMPMSQVDMISGLAFRDELKVKGHTFVRAFDDDSRTELITEKCETGVCRTTTAGAKWRAYWDAAAGKTLPGIVIAPAEGGDCQWFAMPVDRAALYKLLDEAVK